MPPIAPEDFRRLRQDFGTREAAAAACGVAVKQVRRWETGESAVPLSASRLLAILGSRDLGAIDPDWAGWCLRHGRLASPEGEVYERTWFYAYRYEIGARTAREAHLRYQVKRLHRLFGALLRRPRPAGREPRQMPLVLRFAAPLMAPGDPPIIDAPKTANGGPHGHGAMPELRGGTRPGRNGGRPLLRLQERSSSTYAATASRLCGGARGQDPGAK